MSKKSFNEIEQAIKAAAEAHEPAFDEQSWEKMEALLDKEKDRRRPIVFWLWWLLPLLVGSGLLTYFIFNNADNKLGQEEIATLSVTDKPAGKNINNEVGDLTGSVSESFSNIDDGNSASTVVQPIQANQKAKDKLHPSPVNKFRKTYSGARKSQNTDKSTVKKMNNADKVKGKMTASVRPVSPSADDENNGTVTNNSKKRDNVKVTETESEKTEDIVVIKVDANKTTEKEIEKLIDSVVEKLNNNKKAKRKIQGFYILATGGAEANGVRLFSDSKITGRAGIGLGYQLNKNLSVQTGFYISNKKYGAKGSDYKTKPGTYWSTVNIKSIEAECSVYEIPVSVVYNFTPGKKVSIFAAAGLSSYIMKKEDYHFYYERYGTVHEAPVYYNGNKNWFSVLRLSAGVEKKISSKFSIMASPGIAIPLSGVGEGEVKLFSADIMFGLKYSPFRKK